MKAICHILSDIDSFGIDFWDVISLQTGDKVSGEIDKANRSKAGFITGVGAEFNFVEHLKLLQKYKILRKEKGIDTNIKI